MRGKKRVNKKPDQRRAEKRNYDREEMPNYRKRNEDRLSPLNDFSWYNQNPQLTQAAASVPFPYRPGMQLPLSGLVSGTPTGIVANPKIPGTMVLNWAPSIGRAQGPTDPINITGKEIYARVRAAFSGSLDADAPDFIIYLLALDSIFSYIGHLKRLFRIVSTYSPQNYIVPESLVEALTPLDYENLAQGKMKLYQYINELVGMTHKFKCPAVFDLFNRHYWMNDNVYTDDSMANSQFYCFRQQYYLKFKVGANGAGSLTYYEMSINNLTSLIENTSMDYMDALYLFGRSMIDALAESDDGYLISGYLTRAYDGFPEFSVDNIEWNETFTPVYVPEVLSQIENSITSGFGPSDITQDPTTNSVLHLPVGSGRAVTLDGGIYTAQPALSIRSEAPSVQEVVEASRLAAYCELKDSKYYIHCGTEIPIQWVVVDQFRTGTTSNDSPILTQMSLNPVVTMDLSTLPTAQSTLNGWFQAICSYAWRSHFDWCPRTYLYIKGGTGADRYNVLTLWDIHNVTVFSADTLDNIHRMCLFSEFNSFNQK